MDLSQIILNKILGNQQAMNLINKNQNAKEFMDILQNNDAQRGEAIANQILQSKGITREEALSQASNWFSQNFKF